MTNVTVKCLYQHNANF